MAAFFTSDPHFSHENIIKYCNRPFKDATEMNEVMISDWNSIVTKRDTVYSLGDFSMARMKNIDIALDVIDRLNGTIHLVYGNHDHRKMWEVMALMRPGRIVLEGDRIEINVNCKDIALCHYSHQVWNRSHHGAWHLFGHSHNTLPGIGKSMDVGVDAKYALYGDWAPFTMSQLKEQLDPKDIFGKVTD